MAGAQSANQRRAAALSSAVGFVVGFVPWIVYWILVGNAPFLVAVLAGLGLSVAINAITLTRRQPLMVLEAGTAVVFAVFVLMALILSDDFLERWLQPLGNAGLFAIVGVSILIGKPFTLQYARKSTPRAVERARVRLRVPPAGVAVGGNVGLHDDRLADPVDRRW